MAGGWLEMVDVLSVSESVMGKPRKTDSMYRRPPAQAADWKVKAIARLIPHRGPICFNSNQEWRAYLVQAAGSTRYLHHDGPLVWTAGEGSEVKANPNFSYCADCVHQREAAMRAVGRCDPHFIARLTKAPTCSSTS